MKILKRLLISLLVTVILVGGVAVGGYFYIKNAYVKIHNIWNEKIEDYNRKSKIAQFKVYDNRFFIITCGLDFDLSGSVWGEMPYCLYYYDFDTDTIKYCGFFSGEYDEEFGSYYGFIRQQGFAISLK